MAYGSHMYPQLMGPSGLGPQFYKGKRDGKFFQNPPVGYRNPTAVFLYRHSFSMNRMPPYLHVDRTGFVLQTTGDNRVIRFLDLPLFEIFDKYSVAQVILGNHQQTGCILVKPVHNSGTLFTADNRELFQIVQQTMHQRPLMVAVSRMNHYTRRLGKYENIIILMEYFEVYIFGNEIAWCRRWYCYDYLFVLLYAITGLSGYPINQHQTGFDEPGQQ